MASRTGKLACWLCALTACALTAAMLAGCGSRAPTAAPPDPSSTAVSKDSSSTAPKPAAEDLSRTPPPITEEQQFAENPFQVPAGDTASLLRYMLRLKNWKTSEKSAEAFRDEAQKWAEAMVSVTNQVLAGNPDEQQRKDAAALKLIALDGQSKIAEEPARQAREAAALEYAIQLATGPDADLAGVGRAWQLRRQFDRLKGGHEEEAPQLLSALTNFLQAADLHAEDFSLTRSCALGLEMIERYDLARTAYEAVAERFKHVGEPFDSATPSESPAKVAPHMLELARKRLDLIGQSLPISGTLLDQTPIQAQPYAGKVVLLHFWDTKRGTAELPSLRANYDQFHPRGFEVVLVSMDQEIAHVQHYLDEEKLPWPVLFSHDIDAAGWEHPLAKQCGVNRVPLSILIGRDGKVVTLAASGKHLGTHLDKLLAAAEPGTTALDDSQKKANSAPADSASPAANSPPTPTANAKQSGKPETNTDPNTDDELKFTGNPYLPGKRWSAEETAEWVQQMREKPETVKKRAGFYEGLLVGADRVLAADLEPKQQNVAILAKLEALHVMSLAESKGTDEKIRELLTQAKDNKDAEVAAEVKFQSIEQRLLQADDLKPDERMPLLDEVEKFFEKQIPVTRHSRLASATVHVINKIDDNAAAKKQMKRFSPIFMKSKDQDLVRYGRKLGEAAEPEKK